MASRQFLGNIKGFRVGGEDQEPEIIVLLRIPLKEVTDLAFLGAVKKHGVAIVEIQSAQSEMPLDEAGQGVIHAPQG